MDYRLYEQYLTELNSATKYPSIDTYHVLVNGRLTEELGPFAGVGPEEGVYVTEKVDGTNGRIVFLPGGDYFIGQRESLIHAKGDRIHNPAMEIVRVLKPIADRLLERGYEVRPGQIRVMFFEVYGHKIGGQAKQYTRQGNNGARLFDIATVPLVVLEESREKISAWRESGGQIWETVQELAMIAIGWDLDLVPYLAMDDGEDIPRTLADGYAYLQGEIGETQVHLDEDREVTGKPEGLVLRTEDRRLISKMRYEDYEKALSPQRKKK